MSRLIVTAGVALALGACTQPETPTATNPRVEQFARLPNWSGVWVADGLEPGIDGFSMARPPRFIFASTDIPWNDAARAKLQSAMAANPEWQVQPAAGWGYPLMMDGPPPLQFTITPEETLIVNTYRDLRHIYTDGRVHPAEQDRWPTTWGDSIGRWEGDTLVIDTVSVREPDKYFGIAAPLSDQAHYTERLRLVSPDRIEGEMTIEDPVTLARPWTVQLTYKRAEGFDRLLHDSFFNDRTGFDGDYYTIKPEAGAPTVQ
jgi:hypothetical protein